MLGNRLLLGTARYPSLAILAAAIEASHTSIITVSLKREQLQSQDSTAFWELIKNSGCHLLPNTAGCHELQSAITTAELARELFKTNWVKLEIIGDDYTLAPHSLLLIEAANELIQRGFMVFPYCTDDLVVAQRLVDVGCTILMPWASPIGSGQGLMNPYALEVLRHRFPKIQLIVDAGIGKPSHATQVMELGYDGVLLNSAVALARDPVTMASAFHHAVQAGRQAYLAGCIPERNMAQPSTKLIDTPFWIQEPHHG